VLASYGIETAADINKKKILDDVPGFGPALTQNLLDWRAKIEKQFRFDPKTGVPQASVQALQLKYAQYRQTCEKELQEGAAKLRQYSVQAEQHLAQISRQIQDALVHVAQADADLSMIDSKCLAG
jgi:DNA-binding helix-hairpin-helix protein with protein kinase domain